jgi:D-alanyl-D-alanine carboxypeptidase (penicillin-binding protein 5/6)
LCFVYNDRKILSIILGIIIFFTAVSTSYCDNIFDVEAKGALLMDFSTGKVIYEKNSSEKLAPASITKIMVLLLTMESIESQKIDLNDEVIISKNASGMGGSQVFLEEGEKQTVESLIKAVCLRSANDASVALAEHIAGSEELFVDAMNKKAKELEMNNTNFKNVTGLPDEGHYTSAYDVAIMSRELLKHNKIHDWLTIWMAEMKVGKEKDIVQSLVNTNRMIKDYEGANGIKTGSTSEAGFCLSASAKRGNLQLISVVLGCENSKIRFEESKKLLDYGFATYDTIDIAKKGEIIDRLSVNKGKDDVINIGVEEDVYVLVPKNESSNISKEILLPDNITAPIKKGTKIGDLIVKIDGKEIEKIQLIALESVKKANFKDMFKKTFESLLKSNR